MQTNREVLLCTAVSEITGRSGVECGRGWVRCKEDELLAFNLSEDAVESGAFTLCEKIGNVLLVVASEVNDAD